VRIHRHLLSLFLLVLPVIVEAEVASDATLGRGQGVVIAIIDSGINYQLPDLGYQFGPGRKVVGGWDFISDTERPYNSNDRGTFIAGVIAGAGPNVMGVAPDATLLAYRVFDDEGRTTPDRVAAAIRRAVQDGADVINISFGLRGSPDDLMAQAVDEAVAAGVVVCAAAGNRSNGIGGVDSPAAARGAIAVGESVASAQGPQLGSSAIGPARAAMTFKPDVLAPSTAASFDIRFSPTGDDVSTAVVSGLVALLHEKHPNWTPAQIKSALVTTATPVAGEDPLAKGGGEVNVASATKTTLFFDDAALMFGVHAAATGTSVASRVLTLNNRTITPARFTLASAAAGPISMKITPSEVVVPASGRAEVKLELTVDCEELPFPDSLAIGGEIVVSGIETYRVPWAAMRGARITVQSDDLDLSPNHVVSAFTDGKSYEITPWSSGRAERWVPPGIYDFLFVEQKGKTKWIVTAEDQTIDDVDIVTLRASSATLRIDLRATDDRGLLLRDLPRDDGGSRKYQSNLFIGHDRGKAATAVSMDVDEVLLSPSERFTFIASEFYNDATAKRVFSVLHEPLRGIAKSEMLSRDVSHYRRTMLEVQPSSRLCASGAYTFGPMPTDWVCPPETMSGEVEYFASPDTDFVMQGVVLRTIGTKAPLLRAVGRDFVFGGSDAKPSRTAYRFASGGRLRVPDGPWRPGVVPGNFVDWVKNDAGYFGPLGERLNDSNGVQWKLLDGERVVYSGFTGKHEHWEDGMGHLGYRYVAQHKSLPGTIEVRFGNGSLRPQQPQLTSLRVVDALGSLTKTIEAGRSAWIEFSAINWSQWKQVDLRTEATKIRAGLNGSNSLRELPFVIVGQEYGTVEELGHKPAGHLFRVDLRPLSDLRGAIELVIEVEDVNGTRMTWRHPSAFTIEDASPGRRRSTRP
jgi:methylmalonyl-CoA mutase cobalamin-binding subunit